MIEIFSFQPFNTDLVFLPCATDPTPPEICNNSKCYPFFHNVIGAIDGTHIACAPSEREHAAACTRKGLLTQNCLVACSFGLIFTYVLSGWEGSAPNALIFYNAHQTNFPIPDGKYYLADASFPLCPELLVPY